MRLTWRPAARPARTPQRDDDQPAREEVPADLLARVRRIEIGARRLVNDVFFGEYRAVFRGRGVEFDELRPYVPGDDVRVLDWRALARTGQPFVRRYMEDRDLTVVFAVDVSASQQAGAGAMSKADLAAEVCALLALAAVRNRDRVGLLLFAARPQLYLRPMGGTRHVLRLVREVLSAGPEAAGTDVGAALEYLSGVQRRKATVFLISDFLAGGFEQPLRAVARRHDVIAVRVREELDLRLPDVGLAVLQDAESGAREEVDTSSEAARRLYEAWLASLDGERRRLFGSLGIDEIELLVGEDYIPVLLRFFRRRAEARR